ncbi:MAG: M48 family metallopeptidase [Candidatus Eisenbacteria bacterium]
MTSNGSSQRLWARSHGLRAVLAVCFPIFFYAAAAIVGFFLIKIGLRGLGLGGRASMTVSVFCLLSGAAVLWGLLPRPVRFHEPGPLITPRAHPRLFRLLEDVSATMKVKMPDEVYLMPGVNAYVAQIGGLFGIGGRRVLVLGMPLLAVINISELRALVAHELGHYAGGETRLAGIIYQTRAAMARTTEKLLGGGIFFAYLPFEAMFQGYLAITGSISRQQELFADRWAVQLAGTEAQGSLLRHVELGQAAFSTYLQKEVAPLSVLRLAPANYFEGYRSYVGSPEYSQLLPVWESQSRERKRDRSDSHPPMAERILFAESLDLPPVAIDDAGARSLLNKSEDVELYFSRDLRPAGFRAVGWDRVGDAWEEMYRGLADRLQARIPELCVANVPAVLSDPELRERIAETTQPSLIGDRSPGRLP